jgi:hypothetical protein
MILVFAGAGASKAVDKQQYPTTVEFFDRLPESISKDKTFMSLVQFIRSRYEEGTVIDIEQVLAVIEELREFIGQTTDQNRVAGWMLQANRLLGPIGQSWDPVHLTQHLPRVVSNLEALVHEIKLQVYQWYSPEPNEQALASTWLPLMRPILKSGEQVEVFTTNYDVVLEVACHLLESDGLGRIETGSSGAVRRYLDLAQWAEPGVTKSKRVGLLTKLHGSVDWSREPQGKIIYVGDPHYKGSDSRHVLLYPGFKGVPEEEPFSTFHEHLRKVLEKTQKIIFIGFAFRDQYISDILSRYTQPSTSICVIDMKGSMAHMPYPAARVKHLSGGFGKQTITPALKALGITDTTEASRPEAGAGNHANVPLVS